MDVERSASMLSTVNMRGREGEEREVGRVCSQVSLTLYDTTD